jgi:hypothetical protein
MSPEDFAMEKRSLPRLYTSLPMEYHILLPKTGESWSGPGVLHNISAKGILFSCEAPPPLEVGQTRDFTLVITQTQSNLPANSRLRFTGLVARIEPPKTDAPHYRVAVELISELDLDQG